MLVFIALLTVDIYGEWDESTRIGFVSRNTKSRDML